MSFEESNLEYEKGYEYGVRVGQAAFLNLIDLRLSTLKLEGHHAAIMAVQKLLEDLQNIADSNE